MFWKTKNQERISVKRYQYNSVRIPKKLIGEMVKERLEDKLNAPLGEIESVTNMDNEIVFHFGRND
jgi:hypothetical protein